jgi:hypothetical protein
VSERPLADPVEEAERIAGRAKTAGVTLRVMGGVAVALRCPTARVAPLARPYGDIDLATHAAERAAVARLLLELGYQPNAEINLLFGRERMIFFDRVNRRDLDVLVGQLRMCHTIPFADGFERDGTTLTLACLMLTKLQVVETAEKDFRDMAAILVDHPFGPGDPETIDLARIATLCGADWGLWRTVLDVAAQIVPAVRSFAPDLSGPYDLVAQVAALIAALDAAPKTMRWKTRAMIGRRVRWYELPEKGEKTA